MKQISMLLLVVLTGCASPNTYFTHPHQDEERYQREQRECGYEAVKYAQTADPRYGYLYGGLDLEDRRRNLMIACMESKGYRQIDDAEYQVRRRAKGL